ncbi:MAG: cytochrome c5, partial [Halioglobus sp.]
AFTLSFIGAGTSTIEITASDTENLVATQSFDVTVSNSIVIPPNQPPTITSSLPSDKDVESDSTPFVFTVTATDDAPGVTLSVASSNTSVVNVNSSSAPAFTLSFIGAGTSTIEITASDTENLVATQSFDVTVSNSIVIPPVLTINLPPGVALDGVISGDLELMVDDIYTLGVSITDEQIASLSYETSSSNPSVATGSFSAPGSLTIDARDGGTATITLVVTDAELLLGSLSVDVDVSVINIAPVAFPDFPIVSVQGESVVIDVLSNDIDSNGDALSVLLDSATSAQGNSLELIGTSVSYQLLGVLSSNDSFGYRAADTSGALSNSVVVTLSPSDLDADGVVDVLDNCTELPNSDQADMDADLIGDLCDVDPDGDGAPGISGVAFQSGRELVELECLTCHLGGVAGAPLFNDDTGVWDALILAAGGQPEDLLSSVLNGKGAMPAFSSDYSTQELLQAIRYLSGKEEVTGGVGTELVDLDLDGVVDDLDNCPGVPNEDQLNSNGNSLGDACEPTADRDGDGIPFSLDNDDSNAGRLLATYPNTSNSTVFTSANTLRLGQIAAAVAQANEYRQLALVLSESSFAQGVSLAFPGVSVMTDSQHSTLMGVINIRAEAVSGEAEIIIWLSSNLPLDPVIRLFDTNSGLWSDFSLAAGRFASAPAMAGGCPVSASSNYQAALSAGLQCVRLNVQDGGANDADGIVNNQVELIFDLARKVIEGRGPVTVELNPTKSGGGSAGPLVFVILLLTRLLTVRWLTSKTQA